MTEATEEQFASAYRAFATASMDLDSNAEEGRAMLAALQAYGCIPQQQGLTVRQELVARLMCAALQSPDDPDFHEAVKAADLILSLGDTQ